MQRNLTEVATAWATLDGTVFVPHREQEYNQIVALLDQLIDEVGKDESHPLASLMEVLGVLIDHYEDAHIPELANA